MTHLAIGNWGHLFVIIAFFSALAAGVAYTWVTWSEKEGLDHNNSESWKRFSRLLFVIHGVAVFGIITCLYTIISNHYYEYHYAWSHSSNDLPWYYMISSFWEGQEGSFLLWIFWHVLFGFILIKVNKTWEAPVLAVFCMVQAFLLSMIIGVEIPGLDWRLGSSPFILLKDFMGDIPVYKSNPDFIPEDGTGLNLLLQNYWMVIHPPTLFLGFAATLVPFAYCIAGLATKKYKEWVRPALPWALFGIMILGTGILMGGYWAYETLNFGGYWNWDPVENAVYVPWLILVGAVHTMISYKNSNTALRASVILVITAFLLILYSTYLTRSGVLGNASVHSFTDLGLNNQLFIYLAAFALLSLVLVIIRWKHIPSNAKETSTYSREFWIFLGVTFLCLAAFQVIIPTSIPVFNAIIKEFGIDSNIAPPTDPVIFYSRWQIWFAMIIAILSGIGQYFWWKKGENGSVFKALKIPIMFSLLISALVILLTDLAEFDKEIVKDSDFAYKKISYILLWTAATFSVTANASIFIKLVRSNLALSGGAIAHMGIALMLIGIVFSSGYSSVMSRNISGMVLVRDAGEEFNRDNLLLWLNEPMALADYQVTYRGVKYEADGFPGYIDIYNVLHTDDPLKFISRKDIFHDGKKYFSEGDTLKIQPNNLYYEIEYKEADGSAFTLYPRVQANEAMEGKVASPDIKRFPGADLYTHISFVLDEEQKEWSEPKGIQAKTGDTLFLGDHVAIFRKITTPKGLPGVNVNVRDIFVRAEVEVLDKEKNHMLRPSLLIPMDGGEPAFLDDFSPDLGLNLALMNIDPNTGMFTFAERTTQKDFVILKAVQKPLINVLWIGTFVLVIGMVIAIIRRYKEFRKMRDKGVE